MNEQKEIVRNFLNKQITLKFKENRTMKNLNCDNELCRDPNGEIRVLPTGGSSNALLCYTCFLHEMQWRHERNKELAEDCKLDTPTWRSLAVYNPGV